MHAKMHGIWNLMIFFLKSQKADNSKKRKQMTKITEQF